MLLMNKTLLKLARGLWLWILAIAGVGFLTLVGTTALAEIIAGFLGTLFQPQAILNTAWSAIRAALAAAVFTFLAQLLKGLLEYRTAAKAREGMRKMIFSKVLELDAGGIEKIGPVSAITASVDAVEQMQAYFSTYLPSLIYSVIAPIYLFFHLKNISMPVAVLLLVVSLFLLPINNAFRSRIEDIRKIYWRSLDDMTGYYMDSLRGLTTLKLFDRDREHSLYEDQFYLFPGNRSSDLCCPGDRPCRLLCTYYKGFHYHFTGTDRFNAFLQLFFFCPAADERFPQCPDCYFCSRKGRRDPGY